MIGFLLIIPVLLLRYGLLFLDQGSMKRAAHSPPLKGRERVAYVVYLATTLAI